MPDQDILGDLQEEIIAHLNNSLGFPVYEQGVPDAQAVIRDEVGQVVPYYAVQFGDLQQAGARSMAGARGDDYGVPLYILCIAPVASVARKMYNRVINVFLGKTFTRSGTVRKRPGGAMFTMTNSDSASEAYSFPASFTVHTQID